MRYQVVALDYDGTIAHHGRVSEETIESLRQLKASKRKIILVTGRELDELKSIFPEHLLFDRIVAENGALIYNPATLEERLLGERPPESFINDLKKQNVMPLSVGRVIVATWEPHQNTVLESIKRSGIERQVIFNKGAVMVLPAGINKAKGLSSVLKELNYSMHNVVAIGDAENDSAMLQAAECAVVVQNALPALKKTVDWVTNGDHGDGVTEMINQLLKDDLHVLDEKLEKHYLNFGKKFDGDEYKIGPYRLGILLAGESGGGKTTLTTFFLETLIAKKYQFCLVDPEGDYSELQGAVTIGDATHLPVIEEIMNLLTNPLQNVVVNTLAIPLNDRPEFFNSLLAALLELRKSFGHPHWFIFDEAHHLIPKAATKSFFNIPRDLNNFMLVTTEPELINPAIVSHTDLAIAIGKEPENIINQYARLKKNSMPDIPIKELNKGEAWIWEIDKGDPIPVRIEKPAQLMQRHKKKYATGDMQDNSFYFKGPGNKLNLKANNLMLFIQMAEGVDDDTWIYHLGKKEYSDWFRNAVHDDELADATEKIEEQETDPARSKERVLNLIKEKYTAPA
ncbi:MAG: HAD family phosphatase [Bacteroidetes bacterium]|nr:MAG: HAD family phosphatase [Bacteroidota bacterium]